VWLQEELHKKGGHMASINEFERARMVTSLAEAIGKEEATVLVNALNLDGQLASRDELRVTEMAIRSDITDLRGEFFTLHDEVQGIRLELYKVKDELKDSFARGLQQQTRALFFGILGGIGTITAAVLVSLRVSGKL
jgi:hypothetical protein